MTAGVPYAPLVMEALRKFHKTSKFEQTVLKLLKGALPGFEVDLIRATFEALDRNGDGLVTPAELKQSLEEYFFSPVAGAGVAGHGVPQPGARVEAKCCG